MSTKRYCIIVQSKEAPVIEFDHDGDTIYVHFQKNTKVEKSLERDYNDVLLNVDLDGQSEVVSVELISWERRLIEATASFMIETVPSQGKGAYSFKIWWNATEVVES